VDAAIVVEYKPGEQYWHVEFDEAPKAEDQVPVLQLIHRTATEAPIVVEYVPAGQFVQTAAPPADHVPALQVLQTEDPAVENVPAAQFMHALNVAPALP
jgi:hypothetical protein